MSCSVGMMHNIPPVTGSDVAHNIQVKTTKYEYAFTLTYLYARSTIVSTALMHPVVLLSDFATLSKTLGDMWQTVPEKEKMV